jgi:hypothetical protein
MKYSTPNISCTMCSGNISGSIGYCERCAAVARSRWTYELGHVDAGAHQSVDLVPDGRVLRGDG